MRIKCEKKPLCYDFSNVATYLSRADVKAALGVDAKREWSDCNSACSFKPTSAPTLLCSLTTRSRPGAQWR